MMRLVCPLFFSSFFFPALVFALLFLIFFFFSFFKDRVGSTNCDPTLDAWEFCAERRSNTRIECHYVTCTINYHERPFLF